jgi:5-(carboxyamino)imidazole ribonucleotide synthase
MWSVPEMRIGVVGGGQLALMLAQAGESLGHTFIFYDENAEACARELGPLTCAGFDDREALERFASEVELVTCEFENVPASSIEFLATRVPIFPGAQSFRIAQDRLLEKERFAAWGIPIGSYCAVETVEKVRGAAERLGVPGLIKTRRGGYDGKGQAVVKTLGDVRGAWDSAGGMPSLYETMVPFDRELSMLGARSRTGEIVCYPLVENTHRGGILICSRAPAMRLREGMQSEAEGYMRELLEGLDHVGMMAIEFFECDGVLLANEMAPRVHNTGHWTIEGAVTSQFRQHLRAICGSELGDTTCEGCSVTLNVLGEFPAAEMLPAIEGVSWHRYGKRPKPGRKVGHVTLHAGSGVLVERIFAELAGHTGLADAVPALGSPGLLRAGARG